MKHLLMTAILLSLSSALLSQEEGTRILYPRPDTTLKASDAEATAERVRYPTAHDEPAPQETPSPERVIYPEAGDPAREPEEAPVREEEGTIRQETYSYYPRRPRQSKTLLGNRGRGSGFYGAFSVNAGEIANENAILIGGRAAWVMGGGFGLGFGGYALANDVIYGNVNPGHSLQLEMAYGGLYLEPMVATRSPIYLSFPILLGVGGAIYTEDSFRYNDRFDWDRDVEDSDLFFVLEPGAYLEFHIVRFFRIGIGAQYRIISDLDLVNTANDAFNGWAGGLTLKFGNY